MLTSPFAIIIITIIPPSRYHDHFTALYESNHFRHFKRKSITFLLYVESAWNQFLGCVNPRLFSQDLFLISSASDLSFFSLSLKNNAWNEGLKTRLVASFALLFSFFFRCRVLNILSFSNQCTYTSYIQSIDVDEKKKSMHGSLICRLLYSLPLLHKLLAMLLVAWCNNDECNNAMMHNNGWRGTRVHMSRYNGELKLL